MGRNRKEVTIPIKELNIEKLETLIGTMKAVYGEGDRPSLIARISISILEIFELLEDVIYSIKGIYDSRDEPIKAYPEVNAVFIDNPNFPPTDLHNDPILVINQTNQGVGNLTLDTFFKMLLELVIKYKQIYFSEVKQFIPQQASYDSLNFCRDQLIDDIEKQTSKFEAEKEYQQFLFNLKDEVLPMVIKTAKREKGKILNIVRQQNRVKRRLIKQYLHLKKKKKLNQKTIKKMASILEHDSHPKLGKKSSKKSA